MIEFGLGDLGIGGHRKTVNLVQPCDICCDICDVDSYCEDSTVSLFVLTHTLEHVPSQRYAQFLRDLYRKLEPGGCVEVVQTDVGRVLEMIAWKEIPLRVGRMAIFTPADRLRENPHHLHHNLWSEDMLREDFETLGYRTEVFSAGHWNLDLVDELFPEQTRQYHGVPIPNLGIRCWKRDA